MLHSWDKDKSLSKTNKVIHNITSHEKRILDILETSKVALTSKEITEKLINRFLVKQENTEEFQDAIRVVLGKLSRGKKVEATRGDGRYCANVYTIK